MLVVVRTDQVHRLLARQFAERTVTKHYLAIVCGVPDRDRDRVDRPIGAHPHQREKMTIRENHATSRPAQTDWEVVQRFETRRFALMLARPRTGRTHQIRVHLAHAGFPVLCDRLYGGRSEITRSQLLGQSTTAGDEPPLLRRQALHAWRLRAAPPDNRAASTVGGAPSQRHAGGPGRAPVHLTLDCRAVVDFGLRPRASAPVTLARSVSFEVALFGAWERK